MLDTIHYEGEGHTFDLCPNVQVADDGEVGVAHLRLTNWDTEDDAWDDDAGVYLTREELLELGTWMLNRYQETEDE